MKAFLHVVRFLLIAGVCAGLLLAPTPVSARPDAAQIPGDITPGETPPYFESQTLTLANGVKLEENIISGPPHPPSGFERAAANLPAPNIVNASAALSVPAYTWLYGCSSVSAAMIAAYYDRTSYPNMYAGPTNGGVMPMDDSDWGTWSDGADTYPSNPLVASQQGLDGRAVKGSINDYWVSYLSGAADPYITGGWSQHAWGDAIGDYMKTSQSSYGNVDGSTTFFTYTSTSKLTCATMETIPYNGKTISQLDGTYGRKQFYEARGYTVTDCYNQKTDATSGFTFASYKAEIDAGRPVLINLEGHSVVGVGYDDATETVYLNDTWDNATHSMIWNARYSGMKMQSVSIVNVAAPLGGFNKTSPADTAADQPRNLTLAWGASSGATGYEYCLDQTPGATCDSAWVSTGSAQSASLTNLQPGATYYWQVRAVKGTHTLEANGGAWWRFTIRGAPTLTAFAPASDIPGNTITLTGTNFTGATGVAFGALNATYTVVSPTQITTTVPAGAQTGKISVTTPEGTATSTADFIVPTVQLGAASFAVSENAGSLDVPVTLTATASTPVTVNFATTDGTAVSGQDYTAASGTLTFAAGETSKVVTLTILNDALDEPTAETLTVALSSPTGVTLGAVTTAEITITDDDDPPAAAFAQAAYTAGEGDGTLDLTVTLSGPSALPITVDYATANGTALAGQDYTAKSGTLAFAPGETSKTITLALLADALDEVDSETLSVALSAPTNAALGAVPSTEITLSDDDDPPTVQLDEAAYSVSEDGTSVDVTVTLSAASARPITTQYASADGTALAPGDYTAASGMLTFLPGETSKTVTLTVVDDALDEADTEAFTLTLSSPANASLGTPAAAEITITDDDDQPEVAFSQASYTFDEDQGSVDLTVTLNAASGLTVTVDYDTSDATALHGEDYTAASGTLTFTPGQTSKTITLALLDDALDEADTESLTVTLSSQTSAALSAQPNIQVNINDDDDPPAAQLEQDAYTALENDGTVELAVSLSAPSALPVTIAYATADGTALAPGDYTARSGTLTFAPGDTTKTITIPVIDDPMNEPDSETFSVEISAPTSASLGSPASALVTITDNDGPPAVRFAQAVTSAAEDEAEVSVTVTLSAPSSTPVTVDFATADGTALDGEDYTANSGTLTFAPGQTSKTIAIALVDDLLDEADSETLTVTLSSPTGEVTLGTPGSVEVTLTDDDALPEASFTAAAYSVSEDETVLKVTVTLSAASARTVTVTYATVDGTALAGQDFTAKTGTLTFAPGETSKEITLTILNDIFHEGEEAFTLRLSNAVNAALPAPDAACAIVDEDPEWVRLLFPIIMK